MGFGVGAMIIRKKTSIEVLLNLEDFLEKRNLDTSVSSDLLKRDLQMANKYYSAFSEIRRGATNLKWFFYFSSSFSDSDCMVVDETGTTRGREINFKEIKEFSDYIVKEYGI